MRGRVPSAGAIHPAVRLTAVSGNLLPGKSRGPCQGHPARLTSTTGTQRLDRDRPLEKSRRQSRSKPPGDLRLKPALHADHRWLA